MDGGRGQTNPYDSKYSPKYYNSISRRNFEPQHESEQSSQTSSSSYRFNNYNRKNISPPKPASSSSSFTSSTNNPLDAHIKLNSFNKERHMSTPDIKREVKSPSLTPSNSFDYSYTNLENSNWPSSTNFEREDSGDSSNIAYNQPRPFSNSFVSLQNTDKNRSHNSTMRYNNCDNSQKPTNSMSVDLINIDDFDAESLFDTDGDGPVFEMTQKSNQISVYHSSDKHISDQSKQHSNSLEYAQHQGKRHSDKSPNRNDSPSVCSENKRARHTKFNIHKSSSITTDLTHSIPDELTEDQIQDRLHEAINSNDKALSMKYLELLKQAISSSNMPQHESQQLTRSQVDPSSSSSSRKESKTQTSALKEELDKIMIKQNELDLLKARAKKLAEEIEGDRNRFLSMFQSVLPGGKNFFFPSEPVDDQTSAHSSSDSEKRSEPGLDTRLSASKFKTPEPSQARQSQSNRVISVQSPRPQTPPQPDKNNTQTNIALEKPKFKGFSIHGIPEGSKVNGMHDIKASGYDDKLKFNPPYYKMSKQNRKCRSLILGNQKYPFKNRNEDIAITSCMNGIITIYSGKDYDTSTQIDLKEINYRWAEDVCFVQPDVAAVVAYSDSMKLAPTPVSLLSLGNSSTKNSISPYLIPLDIQTFEKPLSCITPVCLNKGYIEFVTGSADHKVTLWQTTHPHNKSRNSVNTTVTSTRVGHSSMVNTVAFDPNTKLLYSGGSDCKYFITDLTNMNEVYSNRYSHRVNQILVHPTIPHLQVVSFACENKQFQLIDTRIGSNETLAHFGFQIGKLLTKYAKHTINHRGNLIACNDPTNNDILIWDIRYIKVDQEFQRYKSHDKKVNCVQFSPFKDNLVFSDENTQLGLVDFNF